jgi:hypothetical protein
MVDLYAQWAHQSRLTWPKTPNGSHACSVHGPFGTFKVMRECVLHDWLCARVC